MEGAITIETGFGIRDSEFGSRDSGFGKTVMRPTVTGLRFS
jgi:hypothetical protein